MLRNSLLNVALASVALLLWGCNAAYSPAQSELPPMPAMTSEEKALITKADTARTLGKTDQAITLYHQAAELSQGAVRAHLELADMYMSRSQNDAAWQVLETAYGLYPNSEVIKSYAQLALIQGDSQKTLALTQQALTYNPHDVRVLNTQAVALNRLGEHREAKDTLHTAMEHAAAAIDKEYTANNLALTYIALKDAERAIALIEKTLPRAQNKPELRQLLAMAYGVNGNTDKAYELGLMDMNVQQVQENLRFYRQLRDGKIDSRTLFIPANIEH
ncbi:MAG: tetratricopeptide repeat protein [Alphaproteobacteria bacterium]|nr:tetratricopeptide repeat protein [Alphaproteobacteria bacterium]